MRHTSLLFVLLFLLGACQNQASSDRPAISFFSHPAGEGSRYPFLHTTENGKVLMSWLQEKEEGVFRLKFASWQDGQWTEPAIIFEGDDFFDNWADFPSVTWSPAGYYAAHWLRKVDGGYFAYHVQMSFSEDGRSWSAPVTPHLDLSPSEHGFVSLEPLPNGRILAVWLDGRNTAAAFESRGEHNEAASADASHTHHDNPNGAMTLRSAEISPDGSIHHKHEIDARVCDCCPTRLVRDDTTAWVVYRNRSEAEVRDFYVAAYNLASASWSKPVAVHADGWQIGGCPVNGAEVAVSGDVLRVSWFTAADNDARVLTATAATQHLHFGAPMQLSTGDALGRVNSASRDGTQTVLWLEQGAGDTPYADVYLSRLSGANEIPVLIPLEGLEISRSRLSGFPQLTALPGGSDRYLLAWTRHEPSFGIEMRTVRISGK